jgi:hypothetical protein
MRHCPVHPEVGAFGPNTSVRVAVVPHPVFVHGICPKCWLSKNENPTTASIGLVERPAWWSERGGGLHCDEHSRYFAIDQACRKCVDTERANVD